MAAGCPPSFSIRSRKVCGLQRNAALCKSRLPSTTALPRWTSFNPVSNHKSLLQPTFSIIQLSCGQIQYYSRYPLQRQRQRPREDAKYKPLGWLYKANKGLIRDAPHDEQTNAGLIQTFLEPQQARQTKQCPPENPHRPQVHPPRSMAMSP